jgi:hypothetical protein
MTDTNLIVETLVADDPRRAADRMIAKLCAIASAQGGALLQPAGNNATVLLSHQLPLASLAGLTVRWNDHREALGSGKAIVERAFALVPVMTGGDLVGAVFLSEPSGVSADRLRAMVETGAPVFAATIASGPAAAAPVAARGGDVRGQLVRILEGNDWNIAKVSRLMGVTRRTLYMRMSSFGIKRKKVPRLIKPITI